MRDFHKTIEAVWKIESTRLIAGIARVTGDIGIAEELAQDALVTALKVWPEEGIPENPGAWLMTAAKRRAIDTLRRGRIAACHMRARTAEETDWDRIVLLYDALMQISLSPIVALNRAVAVGMAQGPAARLDALDAAARLAGGSALANYHLLPSVRGDLLMKMGRFTEAREEIQRAITMTNNLREQELLADRLNQIEKAALSA